MVRDDTIIYRIMKRMRKFILGCLVCLGILPVSASVNGVMNEPDSVYLFSYCTTFDEGKSGLKFAWSQGDDQWFSVGNDWAYVKSDFGPWGSFKNIFPFSTTEDSIISSLLAVKCGYFFAKSPPAV